jgi:hypothetical protein
VVADTMISVPPLTPNTNDLALFDYYHSYADANVPVETPGLQGIISSLRSLLSASGCRGDALLQSATCRYMCYNPRVRSRLEL